MTDFWINFGWVLVSVIIGVGTAVAILLSAWGVFEVVYKRFSHAVAMTSAILTLVITFSFAMTIIYTVGDRF